MHLEVQQVSISSVDLVINCVYGSYSRTHLPRINTLVGLCSKAEI